jgi:hypothetical protein
MNERIKELIKQCEDYGSWDNKVYTFDKEKFAELIVKETMQVVANNLPQNTYLDVADAVIEHFKE